MRPHAITLRQLQYIVVLAETSSFRRAAERCHVSQPALSVQVAAVESLLGHPIFERDSRRVKVTLAGEEVVAAARRVLAEADRLAETIRRLNSPQRSRLRVGVIPTVSPYLLPLVAGLLKRRFPSLTLLWHEDRTPALIHALQAGDIDAAIVALETTLPDLAVETLFVDPFVLALPRRHRLARQRIVDPSILERETILLLDEGHCLREQALRACQDLSLAESSFRATSLTTLAEMVAAGVGITLLPALAIRAESRGGRFVVRPLSPPVPRRTIALVWRRQQSAAPFLREVAMVLKEAATRG